MRETCNAQFYEYVASGVSRRLFEEKRLGYSGPIDHTITFFDGAGSALAAVLYALTPIIRPSPGAVDRSMDEVKVHEVRFVMAKALVTPSGKKSGHKRRSTPRTELRGVLILSRLISTVLKGVSTPPKKIMIFGDSQTIIGTLGSTD